MATEITGSHTRSFPLRFRRGRAWGSVGITLAILAVIFGVYPMGFLRGIEPQVVELARRMAEAAAAARGVASGF